MENFGIEMDKMFKFNSSHFVAYEGFREPLHGHNYKVSIKIKSKKLNTSYYVIDFDIVKTLMTKICDELKHCLLLPKFNTFIKIEEIENSVKVTCEDGSIFTFPTKDVKIIETEQISAECLAKYILHSFYKSFKTNYEENFNQIELSKIEVKVSEDKGKSGIYYYKFN